MNKVELVGRLYKDVTFINNGTAVAKFGIACDRRYKKDGEPTADFISCVAFGKTAEFINQYFSKGSRIGISGRIQTGSHDNKDGQKVYTTDVVVDEAEFVESKNSNAQAQPKADESGYVSVADDCEELPFK